MITKIERKGKKPVYRVEIYLGYDPVTKKKDRIVRTFKTNAEAKEFERKTINAHKSGDLVTTTNMTVAEYLDYWMEEYASNLQPQTQSRYKTFVSCIKKKIGTIRLKNLRTIKIDQLYTALRKEEKTLKSTGERVRRYADGTVLKVHKMLSTALEQAVKWEMLPKNPAANATPPADDDREVGYWTKEEGEKFLNLIKDEYIWLPCYIVFYTGLRIGEVLALTWDNVDLDRGLLYVKLNVIRNQEKKIWKVVPKVKTKKSKDSVYLPETLIQVLQAEKARQEQEQEAAKNDDSSVEIFPMIYVCRGMTHPFMTPTYVSHRFTELVKSQNQLRKITFHGLRHTHASMLFAGGASSQEISKRLRHTRVATTDDIYIHVDEDIKKKTAEILDRPLFGHPEGEGETENKGDR